MKKGEILKLEVAYKNKYASNLEEDIAKYAEDRNKGVQRRFIEEGIMIEQKMRGGANIGIKKKVFWNNKNELGKRSCRFFMKLVSGLPLRYMLYKEIFRK
ncbi:MAG: hypothetical protein IID03_12090 [Candidatus Dadabacteria bacterium]|nr:hypothetical protein [Candidatus Dadabacteria bacterium]